MIDIKSLSRTPAAGVKVLLLTFILLVAWSPVFGQEARQSAKAVHDWALKIASEGAPKEALDLLTAHIKTSPGSSWIFRAFVLVTLDLGYPEILKEELDEWVQGPGGSMGPSFAQAFQRYRAGDFADAKHAIQRCLDSAYREPLVMNLAGAIEISLGRPDEALPLIREALEADPEFEMARHNLFEARARSVMKAASEAWSKGSATNFEALAERLEAEHADGPEPLKDVFIGTTRRGFNRRALITAVERNGDGLLLLAFDPPLTASQESPAVPLRLPYQGRSASGEAYEWQLIDTYGDRILFVKRTEITGSHHGSVTYFHIDEQARAGHVSHEWQVLRAIWDRDFDADGYPELVLDFSDYYIKNFASAIVDPNYAFLRYDHSSGEFRDIPLTVELSTTDPRSQRVNAQAVALARRGDWVAAHQLLQSDPLNMEDSDFEWNKRIVGRHAEHLMWQSSERPSLTTSVLAGQIPEHLNTVDWDDLDSKVVIMRLLDLALSRKWPPERLETLMRHFYSRGYAFADLERSIMPLSIGKPDEWLPRRVRLLPEVRALESAALTYVTGQLVYVPPGVEANAILEMLDSTASDNVSAKLARSAPRDLSRFEIEYGPASLSERYTLSQTLDRAFTDLNPYPILNRIMSLVSRKNFHRASLLLEDARAIWQEDPEVRPLMDLFQRAIDMRYGRYYDVFKSLDALGKGDRMEIANFKAFEKIGMAERARETYQMAVETSGTQTEGRFMTNDAPLAFEGFLGLGRVALSRGDNAAARKYLSTAIEIAQDHYQKPMHHRTFPEAVLALARAELGLGRLETARVFNNLAFRAVTQIDQGSGWLQSAGQFDLELLPEILFNDFLIAQEAGDDRLALAYMAASISVVQDVYRLSSAGANRPGAERVEDLLDTIGNAESGSRRYRAYRNPNVQEAYPVNPSGDSERIDMINRLGLSEIAHRIYREAVRFQLEKGRTREAFALLNGVKETTALQHLLRRIQRSEDQRSVLLTIPFEDLIAPVRGTGLTVIQYLVQDESVIIFLLQADGTLEHFERPLDRSELRADVEKVLDLTLELGALHETAALEARLRNLYLDLIAPIAARLPDGGPVLILPDRELHAIPFEMLQSAAGRFLVEDHPVSYGTSLSSFAAIAHPDSRAEQDILLVHSPITQEMDALAASAVEVARIKDIFGLGGRIRELSGRSATRAGFVAAAAGATLVHVATHSAADSFHPERSSILLSESYGGQEISLADFLEGDVPLKRSPLVVLSSCSSAVGKIYEEASVSLASGLLLSGASAVVVTQWEVVDAEAPDFMERFYRSYFTHRDAARALRDAKIEAIRLGLHPQAWAPYVVYGKSWSEPK